jgi:hypothetical protein
MGFSVGAVVLDRPTNSVATVVHVTRVPRTLDLFGKPLPRHDRFVLRFEDSRWADDRIAADLLPVEPSATG